MTKEELLKAKSIIDEINRIEEVCDTLKSEIEGYEFESPTKITKFDLVYNDKHKRNLNEAEVKHLHDIFRSEIDGLTKELKQII